MDAERRNDYAGKAGISEQQAVALRMADAYTATHVRYDDEDMKQEARAAALEATATHDAAKGRVFESWVYFCVRNAVVNYCRREMEENSGIRDVIGEPDPHSEDGEPFDVAYEEPPEGYEVPGEEPGESLYRKQQIEALLLALQTLPTEAQATVRLFYGLDCAAKTAAEIARMQGVSEGAIEQQLLRAKKKLKSIIQTRG